jgi:hypothetical protein
MGQNKHKKMPGPPGIFLWGNIFVIAMPSDNV